MRQKNPKSSPPKRDAIPAKAEAPLYKWRVKKSEHGMSLENFIYKQLGEWSHGQVKKAIDGKRAFVNGRNIFISKWNVKAGDAVQFVPAKNTQTQATLPGGRYRFVDVLFEDDAVIVALKPAFVDEEQFTLMVRDYIRRKFSGSSLPYIGQMHRLDKETSGAMVFTKKKAANTLADQFRAHTIGKQYLALVNGRVDKDEGVIRKAIEKGFFDEGRKVRVAEDEGEGKRAVTEYRVIERYDHATLLRVRIATGRTHQIRIHMADLGHPIIGDKLYGNEKGMPFKRQALHAEILEFKHPITHKHIKVIAPIPQDLKMLIEKLRG